MSPVHDVRVRIATIGVLLVSVLVVATAPAATVARPPSLLLFNAPYEVETAFGVVRPDGTGRQIVSREYNVRGWSPNGRQIVAYGGPTGLAILDEHGRLVRPLPMNHGFFNSAKWSPDGRWLAGFTERCAPPEGSGIEREFCADLRIMRTDGSEERLLVSAGVLALGAGSLHEWAPDGRALAYSGSPTSVLARAPRYKGIVLVSLAGRKVTRSAFRNGAEPTWAPGGRRLAFSRNGHVYVVGRDGRGLRRLTRRGRFLQPSWSPDGRRIAYLETVRGAFGVQVLDLRRGAVTRIATVSPKVPLVWSPDSTRLTWSDGYRGGTYVFVARADGRGAPRPITEGEDPDWR
jgi:Tol biopolymer transport system component